MTKADGRRRLTKKAISAREYPGIGHEGGGIWRDGLDFASLFFLSTGPYHFLTKDTQTRIDDLIHQAEVQMDEPKREELLKQIFRYAVEESTHLWVANQGMIFGLGPRVDWQPIKALGYFAVPEYIRLK